MSYDFHNVIPDKVNSFDPKDVNTTELFIKTVNKKVVVALGGFVDKILNKYKIFIERKFYLSFY